MIFPDSIGKLQAQGKGSGAKARWAESACAPPLERKRGRRFSCAGMPVTIQAAKTPSPAHSSGVALWWQLPQRSSLAAADGTTGQMQGMQTEIRR